MPMPRPRPASAFAVNDGLRGLSRRPDRAKPRRRRDEGRGRLAADPLRRARRMPISAQTRPPLADAEGFVDTGDMVELRGDRYYFVGRRGGIINIGGLKVHPEEIEAVINRHADVRMSRAQVAQQPDHRRHRGRRRRSRRRRRCGRRAKRSATEILGRCRASLAPHKVPAVIRFVERARRHGGRKTGARRCVMSSSPAAAAASALRSREGWPHAGDYNVIAVARRESEDLGQAIATATAAGRLHFRAFDLGRDRRDSRPSSRSCATNSARSMAWSTMPASAPKGCWRPCTIPRSRR